MLLPRLIPCLDLRDGRVVKGVRFEGLREVGDPVALASRYADAGADELVLLDVAATRRGRGATVEVVSRVRAAVDIPLTVGGGVSDPDTASTLFNAGADRVSVNSAAFGNPALLGELAARFGSQSVVVAIDAARRGEGWTALSHAGTRDTGLDAVDWSVQAVELGAGEILLTSHDRDGTGLGYDLDLVQAVVDRTRVPVIASGGARTAADLDRAFATGATGGLLAGALHDGRLTIQDLRRDLAGLGRELRPC